MQVYDGVRIRWSERRADRVTLEKELQEDVEKVRQRVDESLERSGRQLGERFKELVETNERRPEISGRVEERLDKVAEKTTGVFSEVQNDLR